ncbi:MAG: hypothetical protein WCW36_03025 [Candidatus Paceibacterota bacterium]|jgi:hypothetical protein
MPKEENENPPVYPTPLPRRYNPYGEWRPLLYFGNFDELDKQLREKLAGNSDLKIRGCLQYMLATGLPVIEFLVKSDFIFPYPDNGTNHEFGHLHMRKIQVVNLENNTAANSQVYDCSIEIPEVSIEAIENGLDLINVLLYRLTYGLNAKYELILKYSGRGGGSSLIELTNEDTDLAIEYVSKFIGEDSRVLDRAISWYQVGNRLRSSNKLFSFLSYYLALEMLALKLYSGEMEASKEYGFKPLTKDEKKSQTDKCILDLELTGLLKSNPEKFAKQAYEECILGNYRKTKEALSAVFGAENALVKDFRKKIKKDGEEYTLYTVRSKIAHGEFTPIEEDQMDEIVGELPNIADLTRKFISKILWKTEPTDIERRFQVSMIMADPRSSGITNDTNMIARHDWRIRLEWLY